MSFPVGTRVSWTYQGKRTYGIVKGVEGTRGTMKTSSGGTVRRVGTKDNPIIRIESESTGNPVLRKQSELKREPKNKVKKK